MITVKTHNSTYTLIPQTAQGTYLMSGTNQKYFPTPVLVRLAFPPQVGMPLDVEYLLGPRKKSFLTTSTVQTVSGMTAPDAADVSAVTVLIDGLPVISR